MRRIDEWKRFSAILLFFSASNVVVIGQTTLIDFDYVNGALPQSVVLVQGVDGGLYGTTSAGGTNRYGTVFRATRGGVLTTLYHFCVNCVDGQSPLAGLIQTSDGNFYGTTSHGGIRQNSDGTIFKITPRGYLTPLYSFNGTDGSGPLGLLQADDGYLYGTTVYGGNPNCGGGCGTVFRISTAGALTTLYAFDGSDGLAPIGLLQANDGNLYGTTDSGGPHGYGTVFRITPKGKIVTLYGFGLSDGANPQAPMIQATDGNLYGTTLGGGADGHGTVFQITLKGKLRTLHTFDLSDGGVPQGGLVQGTDGNLYGTTASGFGGGCCGTIFKISPDGTLTTIGNFSNSNGSSPVAALTQATNGIFYGTTVLGGTDFIDCTQGCGTVFSFDMGLGPFISLVRESGKVGQTGGILGQGFIGTSSVLLNGTPTSFTVVSDTFIKATVPLGSTTGFVTVTTPSGILTSNVPFRVLPQLLSFDPPSGPPGTQVTITGVSLTQTLDVVFGNRVQSQFTVKSDTSVTATVPQGAKTGKIGIETKGGVAISSGTFEVTE